MQVNHLHYLNWLVSTRNPISYLCVLSRQLRSNEKFLISEWSSKTVCGRDVYDSNLPPLMFPEQMNIYTIKNAEVVRFINFQSTIYVGVLISVIKSFIYQNKRNLYKNNNKRINYQVSIHLAQLYFRLRQNICSNPRINLSLYF